MLGAVIGDVVGSRYEFNNIKTKDFDKTLLYEPCQEVWNKYGIQEQDKLSDLACKLKDYFS